jgi:hypothetical protein
MHARPSSDCQNRRMAFAIPDELLPLARIEAALAKKAVDELAEYTDSYTRMFKELADRAAGKRDPDSDGRLAALTARLDQLSGVRADIDRVITAATAALPDDTPPAPRYRAKVELMSPPDPRNPAELSASIVVLQDRTCLQCQTAADHLDKLLATMGEIEDEKEGAVKQRLLEAAQRLRLPKSER